MNFTEEKIFEHMGRLYMANTNFNELLIQMTKERETEKIKIREFEEKIKQLEEIKNSRG